MRGSVRCALVADVHANRYALTRVLADVAECGVDLVVNGGDTFGYYPWAQEVFDLLAPLEAPTVLGNHDAMVLGHEPSDGAAFYGKAVEQNRRALSEDAKRWLSTLPQTLELDLGGVRLCAAHGTPDDPLHGRLYPDDTTVYHWLPSQGEVLFLAQTHYPIIRTTASDGLLVNPGAVGQPRDGNPSAAWILLETRPLRATLRRVEYDVRRAQRELRALGWHERAVAALDKRKTGI